ncbi:Arc family DNA-binding protein [Pseudomonas luteola]
MEAAQKKINPTQVRLPEDMKERIESAAKTAFRSAHGEILYRLAVYEELEKKGVITA